MVKSGGLTRAKCLPIKGNHRSAGIFSDFFCHFLAVYGMDARYCFGDIPYIFLNFL